MNECCEPDDLGILVLGQLQEHEAGENLVAMKAATVRSYNLVAFYSRTLVGRFGSVCHFTPGNCFSSKLYRIKTKQEITLDRFIKSLSLSKSAKSLKFLSDNFNQPASKD